MESINSSSWIIEFCIPLLTFNDNTAHSGDSKIARVVVANILFGVFGPHKLIFHEELICVIPIDSFLLLKIWKFLFQLFFISERREKSFKIIVWLVKNRDKYNIPGDGLSVFIAGICKFGPYKWSIIEISLNSYNFINEIIKWLIVWRVELETSGIK